MLALVKNHSHEVQILQDYLKAAARPERPLKILEAGCGQSWGLKVNGIPYHLTGIDLDTDALMIRKYKTGDLDEIIVGDLCNADLPEKEYDVIYNSFVLEHIDGAEGVLKNFCKWLKPGGIIILRLPDRNSAYGFLARITPFWIHVFYKKYVMGNPNAGKPGFDPYPVYYDPVVSQKGIRSFCSRNDLIIREEWGHPFPSEWDRYPFALSLTAKVLHFLSFRRLAYSHNNLMYVLQKR